MPELILLSRILEHVTAAYALLAAHPDADRSRSRLRKIAGFLEVERRKFEAPKPRKQRPPKWERARLRALAEEARV